MNISDVEKLTGLPSTAIRFYEERGLITVRRRENGYRDYDEDSIALLKKIRTLRSLDISLADIRLWRDGVVTLHELVTKRLRTMEEDSKHYHARRTACEALLAGEWESRSPDQLEEDTTPLPSCPLLLGIDVGTTTISAQVVAKDSGICVETYLIDHNAAITVDGYPDAFALDAELLVQRTLSLVSSLLNTYLTVASIGITGQMHGIISLDAEGKILSPLYTWQNQFGQRKLDGGVTLCEEIASLCQEEIPTGYGITTYYALRRLGLLPPECETIVTVADLIAARLANTPPILHPTNAAAFGGYDLTANDFKPAVLERLNIPRKILPAVQDGYTVIGTHQHKKSAIPVAIAIGDNQAGVFGALSRDELALLNIGTSSQISIITSDLHATGGEIRPYFDGKWLLSGAALCGGSAYAMLKNMIRSVILGLGLEASDHQIYEYLNRAAENAPDSTLRVQTQFNGTRTDPEKRGSITAIDPHSFTPEALSAGFLTGIADELYQMYQQMPSKEICGLVASGNALRKNPALGKICSRLFEKTLYLPRHTEEAAFGAALFGGIAAGLLTREESYQKIAYRDTL